MVFSLLLSSVAASAITSDSLSQLSEVKSTTFFARRLCAVPKGSNVSKWSRTRLAIFRIPIATSSPVNVCINLMSSFLININSLIFLTVPLIHEH
ncbi:Uncharacterised protein [Vibrio cholerae]|nr:Uncharacterised protein [Vibrio cholerae]